MRSAWNTDPITRDRSLCEERTRVKSLMPRRNHIAHSLRECNNVPMHFYLFVAARFCLLMFALQACKSRCYPVMCVLLRERLCLSRTTFLVTEALSLRIIICMCASCENIRFERTPCRPWCVVAQRLFLWRASERVSSAQIRSYRTHPVVLSQHREHRAFIYFGESKSL
jgi:hypothetical protein